MSNKVKRARTTYYSSKSQVSQKKFHKPEAYGDLIVSPMTAPMKLISALSIIIQALLTAFTIYAVCTTDIIPALADTGYAGSFIYFLFPFITWVLTFGFRFICRKLPMDMWRLPVTVKKGMKLAKGRPLRLMTLLAELETAICFSYITVILYLGSSPRNVIILVWIGVLVLTVWLPCRKAAQLAKSGKEIEAQPKKTDKNNNTRRR